jgi:hypothetical protein
MENLITVTESLSKGLKNRFFSEMVIAFENLTANFKKDIKNKHNRNGFVKTTKLIKDKFLDFIIIFYDGGSKSKPYVVFELLTVIKDREYNSWNEKCLTGFTFLVNYEPRIIDDADALYNISEHAISRLYFRTKPKFKNQTIDYLYIKDELKYIPFWSSYWVLFLCLTEINFGGNFYPVIPSQSGLFMCEFKGGNRLIEIRTFIDDSHLNFEQQEVKKLLLEVSNNISISPLCFLNVDLILNIENIDLIYGLICYRIYKNTGYQYLKNIFFHRIEDDSARIYYKSKFEDILKKTISKINYEILDIELRKISINKFHLEVNKGLISNLSRKR